MSACVPKLNIIHKIVCKPWLAQRNSHFLLYSIIFGCGLAHALTHGLASVVVLNRISIFEFCKIEESFVINFNYGYLDSTNNAFKENFERFFGTLRSLSEDTVSWFSRPPSKGNITAIINRTSLLQMYKSCCFRESI